MNQIPIIILTNWSTAQSQGDLFVTDRSLTLSLATSHMQSGKFLLQDFLIIIPEDSLVLHLVVDIKSNCGASMKK